MLIADARTLHRGRRLTSTVDSLPLKIQAGSKVYNSPPSKTADGKITIMLIRGKVSQVQLVRILLGLESGNHVALKGVEWISCTAYRLEPVVGKNIRRTFNNIDGEKVEYGPIQGTVLPKAIKYFISPP